MTTPTATDTFLPTAADYDERFDRRWEENDTLKIEFGIRPWGYYSKNPAHPGGLQFIDPYAKRKPIPGSVLTCWPWKEGDTPWHQDLGEPYPKDTTTPFGNGVLYNQRGVLTLPE
jgi:hypothetical protein